MGGQTTVPTISPGPQPGELTSRRSTGEGRVSQESIYTQLSQTLEGSVGGMLSFLEEAIAGGAFVSAERANLFLVDFLAKGNDFAEQCCGSYAELLRRCSRLPEVRGMPTTTLASQIRMEVFHKCDAILKQCQQHLHAAVEITVSASAPSQEPGVITTALQGAATGQLAAGLGKHGKTLGAVGAVLAVGEQWSRRTAQLSEQLKATERAEDAARLRVPEYLQALPQLCQDLFDFGCAKCFGAEVDFKAQEAALDKLGDFIKQHQSKMDEALKAGAQLREQSLRDAAAEEEKEQKKEAEEASHKSNKGCGGCLVVVGAISLVAAIATLLDSSSTAESIGIAFMLGVCLVATGLFVFFANRKANAEAKPIQPVPPLPQATGRSTSGPGTDQPGACQELPPVDTKLCAYCGRENPLDAVHCWECGTQDFKAAARPGG